MFEDVKNHFRMLFIIVVVFITFSIPRTVLNILELEHMLMWYYAKYVDSSYPAKDAECFNPPTWCQRYKTFYVRNL
jgi:hypothetical protein